VFTFNRNERSRSTGTGVHVKPEWAFTLGRNTHLTALRRVNALKSDLMLNIAFGENDNGVAVSDPDDPSRQCGHRSHSEMEAQKK
jgi:hypothetical protein